MGATGAAAGAATLGAVAGAEAAGVAAGLAGVVSEDGFAVGLVPWGLVWMAEDVPLLDHTEGDSGSPAAGAAGNFGESSVDATGVDWGVKAGVFFREASLDTVA